MLFLVSLLNILIYKCGETASHFIPFSHNICWIDSFFDFHAIVISFFCYLEDGFYGPIYPLPCQWLYSNQERKKQFIQIAQAYLFYIVLSFLRAEYGAPILYTGRVSSVKSYNLSSMPLWFRLGFFP